MPKTKRGRRAGKNVNSELKELKAKFDLPSLLPNTVNVYQQKALDLFILTQQQVKAQFLRKSNFVYDVERSVYGRDGQFLTDKENYGENAAILCCFERALLSDTASSSTAVSTLTPSSHHTRTQNTSTITSRANITAASSPTGVSPASVASCSPTQSKKRKQNDNVKEGSSAKKTKGKKKIPQKSSVNKSMHQVAYSTDRSLQDDNNNKVNSSKPSATVSTAAKKGRIHRPQLYLQVLKKGPIHHPQLYLQLLKK